MADIKRISPTIIQHKIHLVEEAKPVRVLQCWLYPVMKEAVRKDILNCLDNRIIYPISDSSWISPVQVVPKKSGIIVIQNNINKLVPTRIQIGLRVCIDYKKLIITTSKDHFSLPVVDQMLECLWT